MKINPLALSLRAKKLGVLLRDARLAADRSEADTASAIGVTPEIYQAFELGERSPSLPELEALAFFLGLPVDHFWGDRTVRAAQVQPPRPDLSRALALRQKMLGALLRQARLEAGLSLEMLAERAWTSPSLLEAYELGEEPIPLPDLEVLAGALNRSVTEFLDQRGPLGAQRRGQRSLRDFQTLPPDLQAFVSKPINRPYLELAQRLSEMSVDKLRAVAEGLLEITL